MLDEDLPVKIFKIPILDSHSNVGDGDGYDGVFPRPLLPDDGDGDGDCDGGEVFPQPLLPDDGDQPKPRHLGGRGGGGGEERGESQ